MSDFLTQAQEVASRRGIYLMTARCSGLRPPAWWPREVREFYYPQDHDSFDKGNAHCPPKPLNLTVEQMQEDYFVAWGLPPHPWKQNTRTLPIPVVGAATEELAVEGWLEAYKEDAIW
jgi:hypothetical protein